MQSKHESQPKAALPAADIVDNLLSVVTSIVLTTEFDECDRERILKSLADAMDVVRTGAATQPEQRYEQTVHRIMTVSEARASADL